MHVYVPSYSSSSFLFPPFLLGITSSLGPFFHQQSLFTRTLFFFVLIIRVQRNNYPCDIPSYRTAQPYIAQPEEKGARILCAGSAGTQTRHLTSFCVFAVSFGPGLITYFWGYSTKKVHDDLFVGSQPVGRGYKKLEGHR